MRFTFNAHNHKSYSSWNVAEFEEAEVNPKRFDYNELRVATRNFHEDMKLGAGGFGAVYKVSNYRYLSTLNCMGYPN